MPEKKLKVAVTGLLMLAGPIVSIESAWIVRNYKVHREFRPLGKPDFYSGVFADTTPAHNILTQLTVFHQSWGGDNTYWRQGAEIRWFGFHEFSANDNDLARERIKIPSYIYTSKFNYDSLLAIKKMISFVLDSNLASAEAFKYSDYINFKLNIYTNSIKSEKPFIYYIYGPWKLAKRLLFDHGTETIFIKSFSELNVREKAIKLFEILLNITIMILGFAGIAFIFIKKDYMVCIVPVIYILLYVFFISFIFRSVESRFMVPLYPFLLLCSWAAILAFPNHIRMLKNDKN